MSFSRAQQPEYQMLLKLAWEEHCRVGNIAPAPPKPDRDWYEQELFFATRKTSTTDCNPGRDYNLAMAHFEAVARAGIKWQMKLHGSDFVRMQHELREAVGAAAEAITEDYFRTVVRRMMTPHGHPLPEALPVLTKVPREVLIAAMGEIKRNLRRETRAAVAGGNIG